jgi:hypothetical protein
MEVFALQEVLYESAHHAAQHMAVICAELGRQEEAALLQRIAQQTQAHLGYALAPDIVEKVKRAARDYAGRTGTAKNRLETTTYASPGDWTDLASNIAERIESGELQTKELCLYCKDLAAAKALAEHYPDVVSEFLARGPAIVEFSDGSGAVRFFVKDGSRIPEVLSHLGQGNYGGVPLTIKGGICPGLPKNQWEAVRQMIGVEQALGLGSTFAW